MSNSNLKSVRLGDHAKIISGYAIKSSDFSDDGIPVIKIGNISLGEIVFEESNTQYLSKTIADRLHKKFYVGQGDILISLTGSHMSQPGSVVGRIAKYSHPHVSILNQRAGKVIDINSEVFNKTFLFYMLSTIEVRTEIALLAHGAANQANVSPKDIEKIKLNIPDTELQKKIAAILTAYDDLIENNKRRIAILENMAEEIYREWFVRFRFPGYQSAEFEKGIPKGWGIRKIGEIYKTASGGTPSRDNLNNYGGDINWLKTGELKNIFCFESEEKISLQGLESSSAKIFDRNTVVIAMYCAMPDITILAEKSATNQACCAFIPKYDYLSYIYTELCSSRTSFFLA